MSEKLFGPVVGGTMKHLLPHSTAMVEEQLRGVLMQAMALLEAWQQTAKVPLSIQTLGDVGFSVAGKKGRVPMSKGGELLVWLALHGQGTREQIVHDLWDGDNDPKHHDYFRVAVRRLRAAMRELNPVIAEPIPYLDGVYGLAPQYEVTLDVQLFPSPDLEPCDWLTVSLASFLPEADGEWAESWREEYLKQRLAGLSSATHAARASDAALAVALSARLYELDPLNEEALVEYCQSLAYSGRRVEAHRVFQRFTRLLAELDIEPEESLRARALPLDPPLSQPQAHYPYQP